MGALISIFISIFCAILQVAWKIARFTGVWISFLLVFLVEYLLLEKLFHIHMNSIAYPTAYPIYEVGMIVLMLIPVILVTGYHLYRLIKPTPVISPPPTVMPETPAEIAARQEKINETKALAAELLRRCEEGRQQKG